MNNYVFVYIDYMGIHVLEERLCILLQGSHTYFYIYMSSNAYNAARTLVCSNCVRFMNNYVCLCTYEDL